MLGGDAARRRGLILTSVATLIWSSAGVFTLKKISSGSPHGEGSRRTVFTSSCQPPARKSPRAR